MSQFDLVSLRLFASVIEYKNIAHAARANNIAASAVSKRISDLEARIGASLLYRQRDGVEPTPAGQALYRHARQVNRMIENIEAEISEYAQGARGHVRLWANTSAVTQFLPEDLAEYATTFPEVRIQLREETSGAIVDGLRNGLADLGIFSDHVETGELESRIYRRDTLLLIVPRGHPLRDRGRVRLSETVRYDFVGLQEGSSLQAKLASEASRFGEEIRLRIQVLSFDGIRRMVEAGHGIAILPQGAVLPYQAAGEFSSIQLDEPWAVRSLRLGFRDYTSLPVAARSLIDCLAPQARAG